MASLIECHTISIPNQSLNDLYNKMKLFAFLLAFVHAFQEDIPIEVVNTTKSDNNDERKDLMQDWENLMSDFLPDDMISFDLKKG